LERLTCVPAFEVGGGQCLALANSLAVTVTLTL
jgi:hypothetical protein